LNSILKYKRNKLLADFLEEKVKWDEFYDNWYTKEGELWQPDSDWNQLMKVIEKLHIEYYKKTEFMYEIAEVLSIPIGNSISWIYNKVVITVKLLIDGSSNNSK